MVTIDQLAALEILDSRGRPTVQASCTLAGGASGGASVPSGASTGSAEAVELRDGDPSRYGGLGCRSAVKNINEELHTAFRGRSFEDQSALDQALIDQDGTANKSRLGANALLAVSLAFARALTMEQTRPLYQYFADLIEEPLTTLPRLTVNLFSGGKHAGEQVAIQDVLIVPVSAKTIDESLSVTYAVYQAAAALVLKKYNMRLLRADEGGLAPPCETTDEMLMLAVEAIETAGYTPGRDVALAVDVAATHFILNDGYFVDNALLSSSELIDKLAGWTERYPITSIEDGLGEDDWTGWTQLKKRLGGRVAIIGDDLLCTNPTRIGAAIESDAANALLLKVNQVGTLTEAATAYGMARSAGWKVVVSARSGETEDDWLADLAVGWGGDYIKIGSITQSERLAKYNRLLAIEKAEGMPVAPKPYGFLA